MWIWLYITYLLLDPVMLEIKLLEIKHGNDPKFH